MPGDPWLNGADWRAIKAYWRTGPGRDTPCARCGRPIDRALRHPAPGSLHVGHIVARWQAKKLGWTRQQANALSNSQPEHMRCSVTSGGADGGRLRSRPMRREPVTSRDW